MARLPYLDIDDLEEKDHDLLKRPINLFRQLVNSTGGARAFGTLGHYIRYKSTLDPRIREMAIIQVGFLTKSEYEYTHHIKLGTEQFGVSEEDIGAITNETTGIQTNLTEFEKAVLASAREMVTDLKISNENLTEKSASVTNMGSPETVASVSVAAPPKTANAPLLQMQF